VCRTLAPHLFEWVRDRSEAEIVMPEEKVFIPAPAVCPFCQSAAVSTSPKKDASSYWRCDTCGQVWNPDRLRAARVADRRWR
jgi:transposase-like protein